MTEHTYWPNPHDFWLAEHSCFPSHWLLLTWIKEHPGEGFWITVMEEDYDDGKIYFIAQNPPRPYSKDQFLRDWPSTWGWRILRPADATGEPVTD